MPSPQLSPEETDRFYRIWIALLNYINERRRAYPPFSRRSRGRIDPRSRTWTRCATRSGPRCAARTIHRRESRAAPARRRGDRPEVD